MLGNMLNSAVENLNTPPELRGENCSENLNNNNDCSENLNNSQNNKKYGISINSGAKQLYNLNKILAQVVEHGGNQLLKRNPRTSDYTLSGAVDNLEANEEQLMECYAAIYQQYGGTIAQHLTPLNMVLLINSQAFLGALQKLDDTGE